MSAATMTAATGTLWIAAATPWELRAFEETARDRRVRALLLGMGAEKAKSALNAAGATGTPSLLIHAGFAGAAQPGLFSGTLILDLWGVPTSLRDAAKAAATAAGVAYQIGRIGSAPGVLSGPAEKAAFGAERRVAAVDLENDTVQAWARERGIPCVGAKAVLDALEDAVPTEAPRGDSAGDIGRYLAEHWKELPLLAATWRRQRAAARTLERFLKAFVEHVDA